MINAVSIWNVFYMYVIFLIWQYPDIQIIAIHAFPKIYLDIKMLDFEAKNENILAGFISIHNKMYVSWKMQQQI